MFQSIVVAVADPVSCAGAIETALLLARRPGVALELVHAAELPHAIWPGTRGEEIAELDARTLARAWESLREPLRELLARSGVEGHQVEDLLHVLPGNPAQVILQRLRDRRADLLVLGPHRERKLFDFGSTARALLAKVACAVWVQVGPRRPLRRILVPVDLSEDSLAALERAMGLARESGASISTLHCFVPPDLAYASGAGAPIAEPTYVVDQARDAARAEYLRTRSELDWGAIQHQSLFVEGFPAREIGERQGEHDLVVMGTHGRTRFAAAVLGSVAYSVLKRAEIPVLAIPLAEREWLA
jgi:nucleotide-binding universal stress UspA family protein